MTEWAPVPDAILNQFAPEGMLTAAAGQSSQWLKCEDGAHGRRCVAARDSARPPRHVHTRGLTARDTGAFLLEMYAVAVSPDLISTVTDAVQLLDCGDRWPHRTVEASPWGESVGPPLSDRADGVAARLAAGHSLLRVSARHPPDDLHHKRAAATF